MREIAARFAMYPAPICRISSHRIARLVAAPRMAFVDVPARRRGIFGLATVAVVGEPASKTGWCSNKDDRLDTGWYLGWVERAGRRWFVGVNMDLPSFAPEGSVEKNGPKREAVARAVLRRIGALPAPTDE